MLFEHRGRRPSIHETAFVAPTAVVCGDVTIGPNSHVIFGAVLVAQGNPIVIGTQSIIGENAIIRATAKYPVRIGDYVRVGPNAALYGCNLEDRRQLPGKLGFVDSADRLVGVSLFRGDE